MSRSPAPLWSVPYRRPGAGALPLALSWADGMAFFTVILWGLNSSIFKLVMDDMPPLAAVWVRASLSAALYVVILAVTGQLGLPRREDMRAFLLIGLFGMALNMALFAEGLQRTTASHSGLISIITPLLVFGVSHVLGLLRMTRRDVYGLGLGLGGAALIMGAPLLLGTEPPGASLLGDGLSFGSSVVWGLWALAATPLLRRYGTLRATAWLTIISTFAILPLALPDLVAYDWGHVGLMTLAGFGYIGFIGGALGALLWYGAVRQIGAARTMIYANVQSFFVVGFAALLLGERVEGTAIAGGLLVISGVLLTRRKEPAAPPEATPTSPAPAASVGTAGAPPRPMPLEKPA